mmetsp:Transcript_41036/g.83946  ORF Transcript_41036/g.83946 Transcript_41036/m.83946 type:complete len:282 (+) Transcript_41036:272-1117(+)
MEEGHPFLRTLLSYVLERRVPAGRVFDRAIGGPPGPRDAQDLDDLAGACRADVALTFPSRAARAAVETLLSVVVPGERDVVSYGEPRGGDELAGAACSRCALACRAALSTGVLLIRRSERGGRERRRWHSRPWRLLLGSPARLLPLIRLTIALLLLCHRRRRLLQLALRKRARGWSWCGSRRWRRERLEEFLQRLGLCSSQECEHGNPDSPIFEVWLAMHCREAGGVLAAVPGRLVKLRELPRPRLLHLLALLLACCVGHGEAKDAASPIHRPLEHRAKLD